MACGIRLGQILGIFLGSLPEPIRCGRNPRLCLERSVFIRSIPDVHMKVNRVDPDIKLLRLYVPHTAPYPITMARATMGANPRLTMFKNLMRHPTYLKVT
jgi:hypothetical protein